MVRSFTPEFEITWETPEEAEHVWAIDRNHFAHPLPPLAQELVRSLAGKTWERQVAFVNGYLYFKDYGPPPTPPEVIERGGLTMWHEYLPVIRASCDALRTGAHPGQSAAELAAALPSRFDEAATIFRLSTVVAGAILRPGLELASFCYDELGDEGAMLAGTVLQGFTNESANAGLALEELAHLAKAQPEVLAALEKGDFEALAAPSGDDPFRQRFTAFLDQYGWRAENWSLPHVPTWAEEPSVPLGLIARYAADPAHGPRESVARAAAARVSAVAEIERRLPADKRQRFAELLAEAQSHVAVSEERAMWQLLIVGSSRAPAIVLGRELVAAGVVDAPNDVFFLSLDELRESAANPRDQRPLVAERKAELERWKKLTPPTWIGQPLVIPERSRFSQMMHRFFFGNAVAESAPGDRVLKGNAASAGVASGTARVIEDLKDSARLGAGEVLVCRATSPPWTPLFAVAAAVVTETGGVLSHSAICAREYAIPCVVGARGATTRIADGARVTVDGTKGTVVIEST